VIAQGPIIAVSLEWAKPVGWTPPEDALFSCCRPFLLNTEGGGESAGGLDPTMETPQPPTVRLPLTRQPSSMPENDRGCQAIYRLGSLVLCRACNFGYPRTNSPRHQIHHIEEYIPPSLSVFARTNQNPQSISGCPDSLTLPCRYNHNHNAHKDSALNKSGDLRGLP